MDAEATPDSPYFSFGSAEPPEFLLAPFRQMEIRLQVQCSSDSTFVGMVVDFTRESRAYSSMAFADNSAGASMQCEAVSYEGRQVLLSWAIRIRFKEVVNGCFQPDWFS